MTEHHSQILASITDAYPDLKIKEDDLINGNIKIQRLGGLSNYIFKVSKVRGNKQF
mgnify:CR=1 FL=1